MSKCNCITFCENNVFLYEKYLKRLVPTRMDETRHEIMCRQTGSV